MEEAKLIRMAAAISEYTVSSMLRETVHSAADSINQAVLSVRNLPWIPEHLLSELARRQQDLARLEQCAIDYQKERAAEVEEAQKDLMQDRQFTVKTGLTQTSILRHEWQEMLAATIVLQGSGLENKHRSAAI